MYVYTYMYYEHAGTPTKTEEVYEEPDILHLQHANDSAIELKDIPHAPYDVLKHINYRDPKISNSLSECPEYAQLSFK